MQKIPTLNQLETSVYLRNNKISPSAVMCLFIVDALTNTKHSYHFIGEIKAKYQEISQKLKMKPKYSYGGIASMLRKLRDEGFLIAKKDGKSITYSLAKNGHILLDNIGFKTK